MTHGRTRYGVATLLAVALLSSGCSAPEEDGALPPAGASYETLPPYETVPEPGRTIEATPPASLSGLEGYLVAVVVPDVSASSATLLSALEDVVSAGGGDLQQFPAAEGAADPVGAALDQALDVEPDLVVGLGDGVVDMFGFESAQRLGQQFLVVGAQLAEPTDNVTAVVWDGATSRGSAAGPDGDLVDASITEQRGEAAFRAGLASVQDETTGVVLYLD
ncbi:hypothetical protein ACIGB8_03925 [Promicromonospora sukumoe]|uniref:hypothetical protein n=1 Tax=Promicromonospora sukumoe TaxID=88382 RepID=UPI0037CA10B2